jgi:hypothetical protein
MTAAGWDVPCAVTGLPFGKQEVLDRCPYGKALPPFNDRHLKVSFASRMNDEKQPEFFLTVARILKIASPGIIFEILSGGRISHPLVDKAVIDGIIEVYPDLSKEAYYSHLAKSRVLFNCSLQDWGSVVIPEADTLGCNVLAPAYHSFPELFKNDRERLFIPWSVEDAVDKLSKLVMHEDRLQGQISDYQDKTIERTINLIDNMMGGIDAGLDNPLDISYRKRITKVALANYRSK